jgi:hypothetical protein
MPTREETKVEFDRIQKEFRDLVGDDIATSMTCGEGMIASFIVVQTGVLLDIRDLLLTIAEKE